jgi:hypothetical protein
LSVLPHPPGGRPPVEHRLLGLDRRTFRLPLVVVGVFVLWVFVAPAVDGAFEYDDPVRAGDALIVAPGVTMAPPVGWNVTAGVRVSDDTRGPGGDAPRTSVSGSGIAVSTNAGPFEGDARTLNAQVERVQEQLDTGGLFSVAGKLETVTIDGRHGVARRFTVPDQEGAIFTFVDGGTGLSITISGPPSTLSHESAALGRMLASLDFDSEAGA